MAGDGCMVGVTDPVCAGEDIICCENKNMTYLVGTSQIKFKGLLQLFASLKIISFHVHNMIAFHLLKKIIEVQFFWNGYLKKSWFTGNNHK